MMLYIESEMEGFGGKLSDGGCESGREEGRKEVNEEGGR